MSRMQYKSIFKQSTTGLNSEFSFKYSCHTKVEEPSLPYYLPIDEGRIAGFIPFPRALVRCEMQTVSSRIWTKSSLLFTSMTTITQQMLPTLQLNDKK